MLTRLYRYGPARQRIMKGFVVAESSPLSVGAAEGAVKRITLQVAQAAAHFLPRTSETTITLQTDHRWPATIWLDTGLVWLHTPAARANLFVLLSQAVRATAEAVKGAGGILLPNAVRPFASQPWYRFLCSDRHFLETESEVERAIFCNLLRCHLPVLIALSGHAGAGPEGVENIGSRRLAESTHHFAPHHFAAVSPAHLTRMAQFLRQEEGVPQLWMLDVNPRGDTRIGIEEVELRCIDGQMLLPTVRAQALLFEALLIRARRWAREGKSAPKCWQGGLNRNRARAISDGLQSRFEPEPELNAQNKRDPRNSVFLLSARVALLNLIEDLQYELQVLEAQYEEFEPLTLGITLRRLGKAALQNESDMLRLIQRQSRGQREVFIDRVAYLLSDPASVDNLLRWNHQRFPDQSKAVTEWWEHLLRKPLGVQSKNGVGSAPERLSPGTASDSDARRAHPLHNKRDNYQQSKGSATRNPQVGQPKNNPAVPRLKTQSEFAVAEKQCRECGQVGRADARFCQHCGTSFTAVGGTA